MLEQQRRELLHELDEWSPLRLAYRPGGRGWSALQVLDHLVRTEREILLVVYQNEGGTFPFRVVDRVRTRLLCALFRTDRKVKVPSSASVVLPAENVDLPMVKLGWEELRKTLAENVERLLASYSGKGVFRHPVAGWMDMPAVLDFFSVHMIHHRFQLTRIRKVSELL